ncbi:aldo/keto reductase [Sphaerimonospora thailandensis]|uniref:Oxidoreductase n=1 Tax=Sphaerimonospora thailandensis TaxID=795644 RepID=A0A8J3VY56_9ACTN|nr:aldo/keto reductase [Sphaerimonospora thailandensis]GIH69137.1 oxidoreductase [Sphaerimonospora thailandensis]
MNDETTAAPGGTIAIADKPVSRLGFGTMRLTGPGTWDHPTDPLAAVAVLRQAIEAGITHIDTADAYGPHTVEELVRTALHPYPDQVLVATKVGMIRPGPNIWRPLGRPDYLRAAVEASLRRLATETIGLCYLHRIDPAVPLADQVGELADLHKEGKIRAVGLSKVSCAQIEEAARIVPIAAVQNCLNRDEPDDPAVGYCRDRGIPFVAYRPLNAGALTADGGRTALRWLLSLGDHVAPIPGTGSPSHLMELVNAAV